MDYIIKAAMFLPFMAVVYFFTDYFLSKISVNNIPALFHPIICQFGILDGLSIFLTIIISAFVAKQALSFAK
jgi:hypothetical protein